jgi:methyl-accepting chemotaxis protein
MKIATKLFGAFAIVALLCGIVGGVGWYGINKTETSLATVSQVRLPLVHSAATMMGSMNEIMALERTATISGLSAEERNKALSAMKAAWQTFNVGLQQYKSIAKTAEEAAIEGQFQKALQDWQAEHNKMIDLLAKVQLNDVEQVETVLVARRLDHVRWVDDLDIAIAGDREFTGQLDPKLCGLGKWMAAFSSGSNEFDNLMHRFIIPHEKLHSLGKQINTIIVQHKRSSTGESAEARKLFDTEVKPTLKEIESLFDEAITFVQRDIGSLDEALSIGFGSEKAAFDKTMALLDKTVALSNDLADEVGRQATVRAHRNKMAAAGAELLGILLALGFGYFISRSITSPMHNIIQVIKRLGVGDTNNVNLPMGKLVNCSSIKNCGRKECPSFGKMDACWVTSGSFATIKHCPRAKKGEDCKTCEVYGAHTCLAELGSIVTGMANGLAERERLALAIADGDLTSDVELASDHDALGKALRKMQESLSSIIGLVQTSGEQMASGSSQVADASQSLSQAATESAASLEEITSSMTELSSQTKQNAEHATLANQLTTGAKEAAEKGNQQMQVMVTAMGEINESSNNISKIIKVIDEIAFQTNLLALNAAVEAARAGKHGKGFAVVAEEVRNLAARSAKAAKETADLIEGSVQKTENGAEIANSTAAALVEIVDGVSKVSDLVAEINAASSEQAQAISQINEGLCQVDQVTQQNTASAEESAAAAVELSSQAVQLKQMLARFKLNNQQNTQCAQETALPYSEMTTAQAQKPQPGVHFNQRPSDVIALDDAEFGKY